MLRMIYGELTRVSLSVTQLFTGPCISKQGQVSSHWVAWPQGRADEEEEEEERQGQAHTQRQSKSQLCCWYSWGTEREQESSHREGFVRSDVIDSCCCSSFTKNASSAQTRLLLRRIQNRTPLHFHPPGPSNKHTYCLSSEVEKKEKLG
jgi:hypothetical protein